MNRIINFHEVHDAAWFENVILYLKKRYRMIGANQLYEYYYGNVKLQNICLITVDDGHCSSYEIIYPILKKHNVPAIFFVSPRIAQRQEYVNFWFQEVADYDSQKMAEVVAGEGVAIHVPNFSIEPNWGRMPIDSLWKVIRRYQEKYNIPSKSPLNMTVEQIKQIDREGLVEIGAHTMLHPILAMESDSRVEKEITESIRQLEDMLQHPIYTFAYPNGIPECDFGEREKSILKGTSIRLAFSTSARHLSKSDDVYAIPRYGLSCGSLRFVAVKLCMGKYYLPSRNLVRKLKSLLCFWM